MSKANSTEYGKRDHRKPISNKWMCSTPSPKRWWWPMNHRVTGAWRNSTGGFSMRMSFCWLDCCHFWIFIHSTQQATETSTIKISAQHKTILSGDQWSCSTNLYISQICIEMQSKHQTGTRTLIEVNSISELKKLKSLTCKTRSKGNGQTGFITSHWSLIDFQVGIVA